MLSQSASPIVPTTEEAVVLSKILFIYGADKYEETTDKIPGVIVDADGKVHYDKALLMNYGFSETK